jgi:NodT family efflux transporter outer membrane factor (OMF) lipoprotein
MAERSLATHSTRHGAAAKSLGAACLFALLHACTVGPDFVRPDVELPDTWPDADVDELIETLPDAPTAWWEVFEDPLLNDLVDEAYAQNLDTEIAALRIYEARASLGIATGERYPQTQVFGGEALATGISDNTANLPALIDDSYVDVRLGLDVSWEADIWGRYRRGIEAAEADYASAVAAYDSATVSLTAETARTYVSIRAIQESLVVTRSNAQLQQRSLEIATVLARNGLVTELDVEQARALYESTSARIPLLEADLVKAKNALTLLLGLAPGALDARLGEGPIPTPPAQVAVGLPAQLLRRRPDVRFAEYRAAAQSARVGVATAEKYPRFGLLGTLGLRASDANDSSLSDLFSSDSIEFVAGPVFSWSILNYGRINNQIRVQDARLQQTLTAYRNSVLSAAREAEDAMAGYLRGREAVDYYARSAAAAQHAVDLALVQYREGIADYQRVLDTQRVLNAQQLLYVAQRGQVATDLVLLYKALGGGWEIRNGRPIIDERSADEMQQRTNWGSLLEAPVADDAADN